MSTIRSSNPTGTPGASWSAINDRNENAYDLFATNPARCAASCTESLNSNVLRCAADTARTHRCTSMFNSGRPGASGF
jgi:hypothetical protein